MSNQRLAEIHQADKGLTRRDSILAVTTALVVKQGVRELTMEDVAKYAGITKAGLYHYFDSKADLLLGATQSQYQLWDDWLKLNMPSEQKSAAVTLRVLLLSMVDFFLSNSSHQLLCHLFLDLPLVRNQTPEVGGFVESAFGLLWATIRDILMSDVSCTSIADGLLHDISAMVIGGLFVFRVFGAENTLQRLPNTVSRFLLSVDQRWREEIENESYS